jgi:hypothetical protein
MIHDGASKFDMPLVAFLRERGVVASEIAADAEPAEALVNPLGSDVRWVALCPDCGGAEYVWWDDPRFLCVSCKNAAIGGRFRPLRLPKRRAEIEAALEVRPDPATRGWEPGQSVRDLLAENAERGVTA